MALEPSFELSPAQAYTARYASLTGRPAGAALMMTFPPATPAADVSTWWAKLAQAYDVLRIRFVRSPGGGLQQSFDNEPVPVRVLRLQGRTAAQQAAYAAALQRRHATTPCETPGTPSAQLVVPADGPLLFSAALHRAAMDAWAHELLTQRAEILWRDATSPLDGAVASYEAHLRRQAIGHNERVGQNLEHWKRRLGYLRGTRTRPRPPGVADGSVVIASLRDARREAVRHAASALGCSEATLCCAVFADIVAQVIGETEFLLRIVAANRTRRADRGVIGRLASVIHAPVNANIADTPGALARALNRELLGGFARADFSYEELATWLGCEDRIVDATGCHYQFSYFPEGRATPSRHAASQSSYAIVAIRRPVAAHSLVMRVAGSADELEIEFACAHDVHMCAPEDLVHRLQESLARLGVS